MGPRLRGDDTENEGAPYPARTSDYSSSPNLVVTSVVSASIASRASGPVAETITLEPGPADSIINPMIELPPTVSLLRVTVMSALKRSTICTNFADARACRPRLLVMGISLTIASPEDDAFPAAWPSPPEVSLICRRGRGWQW